MSRHNYSQYYKNKNNTNPEPNSMTKTPAPVASEIKMEAEPVVKPVIEPVLMQETVDTITMPETLIGTVVNCQQLNVRAEADISAPVLCVINVESEVEVNAAESTDEWVSVCTAAGVKGYCMRKYIDVHL